MREVGNRITDLRRDRIAKIERDIAAFEANVAIAVGSVATDLAGTGAEDTVVELERRLQEAERIRRTAYELDVRLNTTNRSWRGSVRTVQALPSRE